MPVKILLVEDDPFLSEIYAVKFKEAGFDIFVAGEGGLGVRKAREWKPELILLDLVMPTMDGFDVLREARSDSGLSNIPIVVLSNLGEEDHVRRGMELGAADYLIKAQYTPTEVVARVKNILNGK